MHGPAGRGLGGGGTKHALPCGTTGIVELSPAFGNMIGLSSLKKYRESGDIFGSEHLGLGIR